jgi:hypothetical protein
MNPSPSFTNIQSYAMNEFNALRIRALRDSLIAKVFRKNNNVKSFSGNSSANVQNRRYTGIHNIKVNQIVGTPGRNDDFDKNFRPLKKHLCGRWINAFLRLDTDGWSPIVVHKVGEAYYIEDGHHRVSVARSVGMIFIEAEVWDHSSQPVHSDICHPRRRLVSRPREVCSVE